MKMAKQLHHWLRLFGIFMLHIVTIVHDCVIRKNVLTEFFANWSGHFETQQQRRHNLLIGFWHSRQKQIPRSKNVHIFSELTCNVKYFQFLPHLNNQFLPRQDLGLSFIVCYCCLLISFLGQASLCNTGTHFTDQAAFKLAGSLCLCLQSTGITGPHIWLAPCNLLFICHMQQL